MAVKGMLHMLENPATADQTFCNDVDASGAVVAAHTCTEQLAGGAHRRLRLRWPPGSAIRPPASGSGAVSTPSSRSASSRW